MTKYLLNTVVSYRVPTVEDALRLRDELQETPYGELTNFSYTTKYVKSKGEIVEEYQVVKARIDFNDPKEPDNCVTDISYTGPDVKVEF